MLRVTDQWSLHGFDHYQPLDHQSLILLYAPLIGSSAINLYLTLWQWNNANQEIKVNDHLLLLQLVDLTAEMFERNRQKLEAVGLLKTSCKTLKVHNHYRYQLKLPLNAPSFFQQSHLSKLLNQKLGREPYEQLKSNLVQGEYEDISMELDDLITDNSLMPASTSSTKSYSKSSLSAGGFDTTTLMQVIADVYQFNVRQQQQLVAAALKSSSTTSVNADSLSQAAQELYDQWIKTQPQLTAFGTPSQFLTSESISSSTLTMLTTVKPCIYLTNLYQHHPTSADLNLIVILKTHFNLTDPIINVILEYITVKNNNRLNLNYALKIAKTFQDQHLATVNQAITYLTAAYYRRPKATVANPEIDELKNVAPIEPRAAEISPELKANFDDLLRLWR